jgi:serine/threonine protein kinase
MESERWKKLETVFHRALELRPDEREQFVQAACADDTDLRREILELIADEESGDTFLESSAMEVAAPSLTDELFPSGNGDAHSTSDRFDDASVEPGTTLGQFQIIAKIGEGGMGEVYSAQDTRLDRVVAIKMLPRSGDPTTVQPNDQLLREARAASALNHRNIVNIHSIENADERDFIVMELVDGDTLRDRLSSGPLPVGPALGLMYELSDALAAAHAVGIVHGDLKPANIVITSEGAPKIVDFGIARRMRPGDKKSESRRSGIVVGSAGYMSPEQILGEDLDGRSDIFSLGSIAYELMTGTRPCGSGSSVETLHSIANSDPPSPMDIRPDIPASVAQLIQKMIAKDPAKRFESAVELREAIGAEKRKIDAPPAWKRSLRVGAIAVPSVLLLAVGGWFINNSYRQTVERSIAEVEELASDERYFEAYRLITDRGLERSNDQRIASLLPLVSDKISIESVPPGASVYLRSFTAWQKNGDGSRVMIGKTPIANATIARDDYLVEIELDGYVPIRRSISTTLGRIENAVLGDPKLDRRATLVERRGTQRMLFDAPAPIGIELTMQALADAPDRMIPVPGGDYRLVSYGRPTDQKVHLDDFYIDRYEVTNREFKEFVDAGGYTDARFWKDPERRREFTDRTGLPGPRSWTYQNYPAGMDEHPVTDVSYFEAAAYAEFRGKKLPTIFQWEKAARNGRYSHSHLAIMPWGVLEGNKSVEGRANFLGSGTMPVDSFEYGISGSGAYNMAGNVSEWIANQIGDGYGTAGGSWKDVSYLFANFGNFPAGFASDAVGFRCVKNASETDQGSFAIDVGRSTQKLKPTDPTEARAIRRLYLYDKQELRPEIVETKETDAWRHESIRFQSAGESVTAHLYLPKNARAPYQPIMYIPSGAVSAGLTVTQEIEAHAAPYIKAGRAVYSVVLRGYRERPPVANAPRLAINSIAFRDFMVATSTDLQRGIDYLETRSDMDMSRLSCFGVSVANEKLTLLAVESRCRAVIMMGAGAVRSLQGLTPEANGLNLVGLMLTPKLMINGRYDEVVPWLAEGEPFYAALPGPKTLALIEEGHVPALSASVPVVSSWLDKTLGPVNPENLAIGP